MRADVAPATPRAKAFLRITIFMAMVRTGVGADGDATPGGETRTQELWREVGPKNRGTHGPRTWELADGVCKPDTLCITYVSQLGD